MTLNGGWEMPAWFDLFGLSADAAEDSAGIRAAAAYGVHDKHHTKDDHSRRAGMQCTV